MAPERAARGGLWAATALVLLAGVALRSYRVGEQLIIGDEWHALNVVQDRDWTFILSHFGHADHSIPLALYYEALQHSMGLGEWSMRLPSVLAGIALLVVLPRVMRPWLDDRERLLTAALLAISPFLVYFSRIARPYALIALLAGIALPLAWRWWARSERASGAAWIAGAVIAAWLNPVSLAVTAAPFLWFGPQALARGFGDRDWLHLRRVALAAAGVFLPLAALLSPPLSNDWASLSIKAGVHQMTPGTLAAMLALFSGSGALAAMLAVAGLVVLGWATLHRKDAGFAAYLALAAGAALTAVWLTDAEWIHQGLVPARYLIGLLPVFLALAALGIARLSRSLSRVPGISFGVPASVAVAALFLAGPVPGWDLQHSQFAHHLMYQFDYRDAHNDFRRILSPVQPEPFYAEIARRHPDGDAVVVEAPWHLESHWNPLPIFQAAHGQAVRVGFVGGLCAGALYGELKPGVPGLAFDHFVRLERLLEDPGDADYLVLRRGGVPGSRTIDFDFSACADAARQAFGPPWRETPQALVFRLSGGA